MPHRMTLVLVVTALLLVLLPAAPALAHGGGGSDASNFASAIDGLVSVDAAGNPAGPVDAPSGVVWRVLANDALLRVANRGGDELAVPGYSNEPYLRIGPDGVWENRNSPAVYLNLDRYARTAVPQGVSAQAEPRWVKVADAPVYAWHDHRIHWMSPALPPQVRATQASQAVVINDWLVPFTVGGRRLGVTGQLRWVPPPLWWPWLLGALAVTGLPLLVALRRPAGPPRRQALLRAAGVALAALVFIDVVHAVDDVFAVPATLAQNIAASIQSALFIAVAGWAAVQGWRGGLGAPTALAVGAGALAFGIGTTHLATLTSSQIATVLPAWFSRAVIAANLAVLPAVGVAAFRGREPLPEPAPAAQPLAEDPP